MAIQTHNWAAGEVVSAANLNTYLRDNIADLNSRLAGVTYIVTGTYTGDGSTGQAVTGLGYTPKYLKIWNSVTTASAVGLLYETTDSMVDNNASGIAHFHLNAGGHDMTSKTIVSLDSDGFTVSDAASDDHPNKNGQEYEYMAICVAS